MYEATFLHLFFGKQPWLNYIRQELRAAIPLEHLTAEFSLNRRRRRNTRSIRVLLRDKMSVNALGQLTCRFALADEGALFND